MDTVAKKMSQAGGLASKTEAPQKGERFRCEACGMEIQVTVGCLCPDREHVHFQCCDREMAKV